MEWLALAVSVLAAAVSVVGAYRSGQAAKRAEAAETRRSDGRRRVGAIIDAGNAISEDLRSWRNLGRPSGSRAELVARCQAWDADAYLAVKAADEAQLGILTAPVRGVNFDQDHFERVERLKEVLQRL